MLIGTANPEQLAARAPMMESLHGDTLVLAQVEVLQVAYEMTAAEREALLPPSLHPTDPPLVTWLVYRCAASPWGPFAMAQTRVECRSGVRLRALLVAAVIDNAAAAAALRSQRGFATLQGEVVWQRHYDAIHATVTRNGQTILDVAVSDPVPLSAADVQYVPNLHLAHTQSGLRLVQIDPSYQIHRAERGQPRLRAFDAAAWGEARLRPAYPVSASIAVADVRFPKLRFMCRPDVLAFEGTEVVT